MSNKLKVTLLCLFMTILSYGCWYGINLYSSNLDPEEIVQMIDYGYVDELKEIHYWHPELINKSLNRSISHKRLTHESDIINGIETIVDRNGTISYEEFSYEDEIYTVSDIKCSVIEKVIANKDLEMLTFLLGISPILNVGDSYDEVLNEVTSTF